MKKVLVTTINEEFIKKAESHAAYTRTRRGKLEHIGQKGVPKPPNPPTDKKSANPAGKMRKVDNPYEIWRSGDWEWRVLKKYKSPEAEKKDPYARWFCAVKSPHTMGGYDMGDVYVREIKGQASKVSWESKV